MYSLYVYNKIIGSDINQAMINTNNVYNSPERSNKFVTPTSPQARRKNPEFASSNQVQGLSNANQFPRKEGNMGQMSPQHIYYPQKIANVKPLDASIEKEHSLENMIRDLSDRVIKISQKIGHHESILIKITENSIENNKEEYKKGSKGDPSKTTEALNETLAKLRKDFDDYKAGNILTRQIEVKNQLFSELIHKSQERMREEMQQIINKSNEISSENLPNTLSDEKAEQLHRTIRKLEKNVSLNTNKIFGANEKIESVASSLDGHIDLINAELNKAINKIVGFVNDKVSKPLNESIVRQSQRIQKLQAEVKSSHFGGMKVSLTKSQKSTTVAQYKQILTAYNQEIIISEKTYYIDIDGYLLDEQFYYLLNKNEEKIRLDESQIKFLRSSQLIS